jgi:hypothetical protein
MGKSKKRKINWDPDFFGASGYCFPQVFERLKAMFELPLASPKVLINHSFWL